MRIMNEKLIAQLESQLEQLVEGTFTNLFRKRVSAHDLAMKLARSMENALRYVQDGDTRPIAPDSYVIYLHPSMEAKIQQGNPELLEILVQHIINLVAQSGYRLNAEPVVQISSLISLDSNDIKVEAIHTTDSHNSTAAMQAIPVTNKKLAKSPYLIINNGERTVTISESLLNIGRSEDNDIVLDDPYCSRHHIQLRLRFGGYTLFDVNSRGGTRVNNIRVTEHQLQSGDVIKIGSTQLTYLAEDNKAGTGTTQTLDPVKS